MGSAGTIVVRGSLGDCIIAERTTRVSKLPPSLWGLKAAGFKLCGEVVLDHGGGSTSPGSLMRTTTPAENAQLLAALETIEAKAQAALRTAAASAAAAGAAESCAALLEELGSISASADDAAALVAAAAERMAVATRASSTMGWEKMLRETYGCTAVQVTANMSIMVRTHAFLQWLGMAEVKASEYILEKVNYVDSSVIPAEVKTWAVRKLGPVRSNGTPNRNAVTGLAAYVETIELSLGGNDPWTEDDPRITRAGTMLFAVFTQGAAVPWA